MSALTSTGAPPPTGPRRASTRLPALIMMPPMAACTGTIHVLRRPARVEYTESISGAHSSLSAKGIATIEKTACSIVETPRSSISIGSAPPSPIGIPCRV